MSALATDPPVSEKQRRAMWAAAKGRGNSGIPEKVAKEFTKSDPGGKLPAKAKDMARSKWDMLKRLFVEWVNEEEQEAEHAEDELATAPNGGIPTAASVLFGTPAGRVLFVKRSKTEENWPDTWSLPGGRADDGEDAATCAAREAKEEIGRDCALDDLKEVERKKTDHGWQHVLYAHAVDEEFEPTLNDEHSEYAWRNINDPPLPLHPGVKASLDSLATQAKDDAEQEETPEAEDEVKHDSKTGRFSSGPSGTETRKLKEPSPGMGESHEVHHGGKFLGTVSKTGRTLMKGSGSGTAAPTWGSHDHKGERVDKFLARKKDAIHSLVKHHGLPITRDEETAQDTALLGPYPVRVQRGGVWAYDAVLLTAAAHRARLTGRGDLARRADAIRAREFSEFAFDRDSVRRTDEDGRLHVDQANISKSNVCEYTGAEINQVMDGKPGWRELDPGRRYKLLRHPEELAKSVSSFNNLPILDEHVPISADNHKPEHVIGTTGTDAQFTAPFLTNSLAFWPQAAIDDIESGGKRELSSAYRYRADMTPGNHEGESYDGIMRDIVGNHVALVKRGRAGKDVAVGDQALPEIKPCALAGDSKENTMTKMSLRGHVAKGALLTYLRPRLAEDTKIELNGYLAGITAKNMAGRVPVLAERLRARYTPALAADADLDDVEEVLSAIAELKPEIAQASEADGELDDASEEPIPEEDDEPPEMMAKVREFLKDQLSPEALAKFDEMVGAAPEDVKEPEEVVEDDALTPEEKEKKMPVTKAAMDAAIAAAVSATTTRQVAIRDAEKAIRPYVGELTVACDSADTVYRTALEMLNVQNVKDIHPSAYPTILSMQKKRGVGNASVPRIAADTAGKSLTDFIPGTSSIQRM